jgi:hypothetical protein
MYKDKGYDKSEATVTTLRYIEREQVDLPIKYNRKIRLSLSPHNVRYCPPASQACSIYQARAAFL